MTRNRAKRENIEDKNDVEKTKSEMKISKFDGNVMRYGGGS